MKVYESVKMTVIDMKKNDIVTTSGLTLADEQVVGSSSKISWNWEE